MNLQESIHELSENTSTKKIAKITQDIETIKKNLSEMKNTLDEIDRFNKAEDWISDLENKVVKNTQLEHLKTIKKKIRTVNEDVVGQHWV